VFIVSIYPSSIARCQHIKVNGTQCGSPSLKSRRLCFFHNRWRETRIDFNKAGSAYFVESFALPVLEDANSIQVTITQVLRLIIAKHLDSKTAGLLLYGLQTASLNLKSAQFEPYNHQNVVIEPRSVADNRLGECAWDPSEYEPDQYEDDPSEEEVEAPEAVVAGTPVTDAAATGAESVAPSQLAEKEEPLTPPARTRHSGVPSQPSLATLLATLVKLERMQKSP
jgi:hypothetical protein